MATTSVQDERNRRFMDMGYPPGPTKQVCLWLRVYKHNCLTRDCMTNDTQLRALAFLAVGVTPVYVLPGGEKIEFA
jgi:hypothetical protein